MNEISKLLEERALPALLTSKGAEIKTPEDFKRRQEEIKLLLQEKEYGYIPKKPKHLNVSIEKENTTFLASKATHRVLTFSYETEEGNGSFEVYATTPNGEGRFPAFLHLNFKNNVPHIYQPIEEIIDRGYAVFAFDYNSVTKDDGDFDDKAAKLLCKSRKVGTAPGKIAIWAWAAMLVMDYIETLDNIDHNNVAVIGHSRLGKTALLAGGFDERFKYIISNDSGCSGAALSRCNTGESVQSITSMFPYWFCPNYISAAEEGRELDFDQHFLLALSVPRHILIGSAEGDTWACPTNEFLSLAAVNEAYALFGMRGLVHNGTVPKATAFLPDGDSCYHIRKGTHYLSREDWNRYMDFIDKYVK